MSVYVFFCNIIIFNHVLYCFIILLHLIFLYDILDLPYVYVSTESVDYILLSSFESKILISSVKILCFSLLNLCWVFNVS